MKIILGFHESKNRVEWDIQVLKEKNNQPKMLYPAKLSFKNEGEIKTNKKLKGRGARDQIANIHWIKEKAREFQKTIYLLHW